MAAARKGRAKKIRRSTPIFHTIRQASPNDGGGSSATVVSTAPGGAVLSAAVPSPMSTASAAFS